MRREAIVTILCGLLLMVALTACGGSRNVGVLGTADLQDTRDTMGVTLGDFEVVRCDAEGSFDPALNSTLSLRLEESGSESALIIGVDDSTLVGSVALEVRYAGASVHVDRADFHGLYGGADVIEGKFLGAYGKAGIAQVCVGEAPAALSGDFATVYFADGPSRIVSAPAGVHGGEIGEILYAENEALPNFTAVSDTDAETATITWYGAWHKADGTQDGLITVGDITAIGVYYNQNVGTNWVAAIADYSPDRLVTVTDITPIGVNYDHGTQGYRIEVADDTVDDYASVTPILIQDVTWNDAEALTPKDHTAAITPGELWPVFNMWQVGISTTSAFNWTQLSDADVDSNEYARVWITPYDGDKDGTHAYADIKVYTEPVIVADRLVITDYEIQVVGTDNGSAGDIYTGGIDAGSVMANTTGLDLRLNSIDGTFNAVAFDGNADPGTWPAGMTQADYDVAFDAATAALTWDIDHGGAIGFRRTDDWLAYDPSATWPITGNPGPDGFIFPDDDPDSTEAAPEGALSTSLPADATHAYPADTELEVHVYSPISFDITMDIVEDPAATLISEYTDGSKPITELLLNESTMVIMPFKWGDGGLPTDLSVTSLELHQINEATGVSVGIAETLTYTSEEAPALGEFIVFNLGDALWLNALVPGGNLAHTAKYAFRFQADGIWSSINQPVDLLTTAEPPPPQELKVVPQLTYDGIDYLQFFYEDPTIRRNPNVFYDPVEGGLVKEDEAAYLDILKLEGDEFYVGVSGGVWPRVAMKATDNPANITSYNDPTNQPGISSFMPTPGKLIANISLLPSGNIGDPNITYSFKWFNGDGTVVGQGTFVYVPGLAPEVGTPVGVNWGVNVFNREVGALSARSYAGKNRVDGGTCYTPAPTPDVLWFEFGGGWLFETDEQDPKLVSSTPPANHKNVLVRVRDTTSGDSFYVGISLRVGGLNAAGNVIAIHSLNALAWRNDFPGWPGKLDTGGTYQLGLDEQSVAGIEYTYPTNMVVFGPNPNF